MILTAGEEQGSGAPNLSVHPLWEPVEMGSTLGEAVGNSQLRDSYHAAFNTNSNLKKSKCCACIFVSTVLIYSYFPKRDDPE